MVLSLVFAHLSNSYLKKEDELGKKINRAFIFFSLVLILAGIP